MYTSVNAYEAQMQGMMITAAIIFILSLVGAIAIYFLFLAPRNDGKYTGFLGWLYEFLSFRRLMIEALLKILYLFFALLITLFGIYTLFQSFFAGLLTIIIGNILIRVMYEFSIIKIIVCKNTSDINAKMNRLIYPDGSKPGSDSSSSFGSYTDRPVREKAPKRAPSRPRRDYDDDYDSYDRYEEKRPSSTRTSDSQDTSARRYVPGESREPNISAAPVCPSCGNKLKPGAKFCPFCGSKVD